MILRLILGFLLVAPVAVGAIFLDPNSAFQLTYDPQAWRLAPAAKDKDVPASYQTVVTIEKIASEDGYHARFSVVRDVIQKKQAAVDLLLQYGMKKALPFLEAQGFLIQLSGVRQPKERITLKKWPAPAFEILASHQHYDLTVHQWILLQGDFCYLLTAAAKIKRYALQKVELDAFFESVSFP